MVSCLIVHMNGPFDVVKVIKSLGLTKEEAEKRKIKLILMDGTGLEKPANDDVRISLGKALAYNYPPPFKVVVLFKEEYITRLSEAVAKSLGCNVFTTHEEEIAIDWLING